MVEIRSSEKIEQNKREEPSNNHIMNESMHPINIFVHVVSGTIALLTGCIALGVKKNSLFHKRFGNYFMVSIMIVVATGILGVLVFKRNSFLLLITLLSFYQAYSGYRMVKEKSNTFYGIDFGIQLVVISTAIYFWKYLLAKEDQMWSPIIIYSTLSYLFLVIFYDWIRYRFPKHWYTSLWRYEHMAKMIGALSAISSAFLGTILPDYQPFSQLTPSVLGCLLMLIMGLRIQKTQ